MIIKEADKVKGIVIMNTASYLEKMLELLANDFSIKQPITRVINRHLKR